MKVGKPKALTGQLIDVWCRVLCATVAAQVTVTEIVRQNYHEVRWLRQCGPWDADAHCPEEDETSHRVHENSTYHDPIASLFSIADSRGAPVISVAGMSARGDEIR